MGYVFLDMGGLLVSWGSWYHAGYLPDLRLWWALLMVVKEPAAQFPDCCHPAGS
jgi:hypothetical protein